MQLLPMFPLGMVVFPGSNFQLRVFEERYQRLVQDALTNNGHFGTCLIEKGHEVGGGDVRFNTGTYCVIVNSQIIDPETLRIDCFGSHKLQVREWLPDNSYPQARIERIIESQIANRLSRSATGLEIQEEIGKCYELIKTIKGSKGPPISEKLKELDLYQLCNIAPLGQMDRYKLLDADSSTTRETLLLDLITEERRTLEGIMKFQNSKD